jgi:hypothetical protein
MDNGNPNGPDYTPAFPAYVSGHAAIGSAMFQVVADFYGTNKISFNFTSDEYDGRTVDQYGFLRPLVTRHYDTISQALYENAESRLYLGIHWPWDRDGGMAEGTAIGDYTFEHALLPAGGPVPAVVKLPLAPQQGKFASPLDAVRGVLFTLVETMILRAELTGPDPGNGNGNGSASQPDPDGGVAFAEVPAVYLAPLWQAQPASGVQADVSGAPVATGPGGFAWEGTGPESPSLLNPFVAVRRPGLMSRS